ncbi:MAG: DNA repair protein RadC [Oculatellaceae cyanobacterium Prado106]|jgi:DNA repair protein RadC|nr:DNA repair protein RadC [Oculatellaceae cyanobacterium Prado106]
MSFNRVHDSTSPWKLQSTQEPAIATLAKLVDTILGTQQMGQLLLQQISNGDGSPAHLQRQLLSIIQPGTAPEPLGLTAKRFARLRAAIELGKRLYCPATTERETLDNPVKAAAMLQYSIGYEPIEKVVVLVLDVKHRLLSQVLIGSGSLRETIAHPRDIFRAVLLGNGACCILAHNHPSGDTTPSQDDISLTENLLQAAKTISVPLIDHLIISQGHFTSLRQTTQLWHKFPQKDD